MNVVGYEPVNMVRQFHDEVNRLLRDEQRSARNGAATRTPPRPRAWTPAVDVQVEAECYVITADVPGIEPENIEITMEAGVLSIKGARAPGPHQQGEGHARVERGHGEFERRFNLPEDADAEGITASSNHGVLRVSIPKIIAALPRRIEVQ